MKKCEYLRRIASPQQVSFYTQSKQIYQQGHGHCGETCWGSSPGHKISTIANMRPTPWQMVFWALIAVATFVICFSSSSSGCIHWLLWRKWPFLIPKSNVWQIMAALLCAWISWVIPSLCWHTEGTVHVGMQRCAGCPPRCDYSLGSNCTHSSHPL